MGIYITRYLKEAVESGNSLEPFLDDFCLNSKDTVKNRLLFINDIYNLDVSDATFVETCEANIKEASNKNPWFFPAIPNEILSYGDMCQGLHDLYIQMKQKDIEGYQKAVSYTLVLWLELDYNAREEILFNNCIDYQVQADPKAYCLSDLVSEGKFELWTRSEIDKVCGNGANQIIIDCGDSSCNACADILGFVFNRYSILIDQSIDIIYKDIQMIQANILSTLGDYTNSLKAPRGSSIQTTNVQLPGV